jgi:hypothetical protein
MPDVSILMPAFRPQYLDTAIASALAQTYTDFELIISDDSADESVASVVSKWRDPRIQYGKNPDRQAPGANRDRLLSLATGRYIKFLFDDDFLLPQSIESLVGIAEQTSSQLVFHGRHYIDEWGRVLGSPLPLPPGRFETLSRPVFFERVIGGINNFIGEPTNILFERSAFCELEHPFAVGGFPMRFLTDVSLYLNFVTHGYSVTGLGMIGSAFRQHGQQTSNATYAGYSAGLFEWELFLRWGMSQGDLQPARYEAAIAHLHGLCRPHLENFPELAPFIELAGRPGPDGYWSEAFRALATRAYQAIRERIEARKASQGKDG